MPAPLASRTGCGTENFWRQLMHRTILAVFVCVCAAGFSGCAVVKTTDVTDASFKRHQSVSLLGWPLYTRVTDQEPGKTAHVATKIDAEEDSHVRRAELLGGAVDLEFSTREEM
jgi:hypothetical protein